MLDSTAPDGLENDEHKQTWREMAVLPMTFPMSIGGTTTGYVVSASSFAENNVDLLAISAVIALFSGVVWLTHLLSPPLAAKLSPQAQRVLGRISGIVLVAIAVQLIAGGLKGLFPILSGS
jgi:multiple antibiotic resistance protein